MAGLLFGVALYLSLFVVAGALTFALDRIPAVARHHARVLQRQHAADLAWETRMGRPKNAADEWREILGITDPTGRD